MIFKRSYNNISVNSNTVIVNGKRINLPSNYNSLTVNNGTVIVDGVVYDGKESIEVRETRKPKKEKTVRVDKTTRPNKKRVPCDTRFLFYKLVISRVLLPEQPVLRTFLQERGRQPVHRIP